MRINLNFKDANIRKINRSEFLIEFNLSKMIKPRLSADARMYIEHFNLCEFIDDTFGRNNGNLHGYFELRCDNIDSNDFDSEHGNTGNTIIYTSPLNNFGTFTNNDPMFISNFKISQNFLRDKLVFALNIFDKNGDPFDTSTESEESIQTTGPEHAAYKVKTDLLATLETKLENAKIILDNTKADINTQKIAQSYISTLLQKQQKILFDKMDTILNSKTPSVANKIKVSVLKEQLKTYAINDFIYIFESFIPLHNTKYPYSRLKDELENFYDAFVSFIDYKFKEEQLTINEKNIDSNETNIWYESTSIYNPININVKSSLKTSVPYEVVVPSGTNKTGTIDIENFTSTLHTTTNTIIDNIVPAAGSDNELVINDVLTVDKTNFEHITIKKYDYYFHKPSSSAVPGVTVTTGSATEARFSLKVSRDGAVYTYYFTDDIATKGLSDGDTITISGSQLGGVDGANDLVITVNSVYVPATSKQYPFTGFIDVDHTSNGTFDIEIERDNAIPEYNIFNEDFTKTKNYNVGEVITIPGTELDGKTSINDAILTVTSVYTAETPYDLDENQITHSIKNVVVSSYNSKVLRIDNTDPNVPVENDVTSGLDYEIEISSDDGAYKVVSLKSSSIGFEVGDAINILGSEITGEDSTNDLILEITSITTDNRIDDVEIESTGNYTARYPQAFEFRITQELYEPKYGVTYESGTGLQIGDILGIDGSQIGGISGDNDLTITVLTVENQFPKTLDISGLSNFATGEIGEIISVAIGGTPKKDVSDGSWLQADTTKSGSGVIISALTVPDLEITLLNKLDKGIKKFENEIVVTYTEISTAKAILVKTKNIYVLSLDNQLKKLKCINCSLVLYDEIPSYTGSDGALTANTYSRYTGCAFKRI